HNGKVNLYFRLDLPIMGIFKLGLAVACRHLFLESNMSVVFTVADMTCGLGVKSNTQPGPRAGPGAGGAGHRPPHRVRACPPEPAAAIEAAIREAGYDPKKQ
ncbi:hypothetical protein LWS69_23340, partial [Bordetella hinzii]|nr:hypothetical protein [Bordetella hinzii]